MKKILFKIHHIPFLVIGLATIVFIIGLVAVQYQKSLPASASSGDIYLTSYETQAAKGEAVPFTVRVNPGAKIDAITATLRYDEDDLEYKSASYETSPFTTQIPALKDSSAVTVQSARLGGETTSSDSFVAEVIFTAKRDGNHTVTLSEGNAAYNGVATNPMLAGKIVVRPQASCSTSDCAASGATAGNLSADGAKNGVTVTPVEEALVSTGMKPEAARRSAPWVLGLISCIVLAFAFAVYLVIAKPRRLWPYVQKDINTQGVSHDK